MPWYRRWRNVFRPEALDDDLERELQYHLAETVDRLTEAGLTEREALREARRRLGNYTLQKERTRAMNVAGWLDETRADLQYGMRQLKRNPGFAAVAILSLALGIGANTAIFQLVNAIRLKTLPVQQPQQLVTIDFQEGAARAGWWPTRSAVMTHPEWEEIRSRQQAFSGMLAWSVARFNLTNGGEPRFAEGLFVSGDFFRQLGVEAMLGRTFTTADDSPACSAGAVVSYAFWKREFGGDPGVLGRSVTLDGHSIPVIGVTPPEFFGVEVGSRYDVAVPLCVDRLMSEDGRGRAPQLATWWLAAMGRLKPGWTVKMADTHLRALSPAVMRASLPTGYQPELAKRYLANQLTAVAADTGTSALRAEYERPLWLLMAATSLVLLIACANLANLLLARATVRAPEIAVRLAIGASRWRLIRQLLAESLLLAISGTVLGAVLALGLSRALVGFLSTSGNPVFVDVALDCRVLSFAAALSLLTCVLFGLLPAWRGTHLAPASAMRGGARGATAGREQFALRRALLSTQVALSLVLLVGALLFVRSLHNLMTVDTGFQSEGVLALSVDYSRSHYPMERRSAIAHELANRLSAVPGVLSLAQVDKTPVSGENWDNLVGVQSATAATGGRTSFFTQVSSGYFRTMSTRLVAGRDFNEHDNLTAPKVAIVNEVFAKRLFGATNPIGRTFHMAADAGHAEPVFEIVGLVANTKYASLKEEFRPIAYFPLAQSARPGNTAAFVLRVSGRLAA
ncbi:ABC transporter permease [uncultured Paludibaculum sp.]|uniref:ABC transporter permease n=1 Tax=uncultured Paludibaculum sp. TaxID=1765020 RepID=UPI002AAAEC48|nr:ABC transporter permease [uncultured Paludibaculum sp.]